MKCRALFIAASGNTHLHVSQRHQCQHKNNHDVRAASVGNGEDFVTDFAFALEERSVVATARAIASAVADGRDEVEQICGGTAGACASTSADCLDINGICGGTSAAFSGVRPCCDPDFRCFRRNEAEFRCRHRNSRLPGNWDGRLEECTADLV